MSLQSAFYSSQSDDEELLLLLGGIYGASLFVPLIREPFNISTLTGEEWTREILSCDNPRVFREEMRMEREVFDALCCSLRVKNLLRDSRYSSLSILHQDEYTNAGKL
jgi:hypothetical protein